ncbi:unnamed protein product [Amoebophrya sp. A25]|nr:unnamed protein product [Amoebophrya sp. A25]|eukprot:GSA25T00022391001.1
MEKKKKSGRRRRPMNEWMSLLILFQLVPEGRYRIQENYVKNSVAFVARTKNNAPRRRVAIF